MESGYELQVLACNEYLTGFTPLRRRKLAPVDQSPITGSRASWTAARCNRLLRPISSRVLAFRKDRQGSAQGPKNGQDSYSENPMVVKDFSSQTPVEGFAISTPAQNEDDPEWNPGFVPRKRLKRTYSSKSSGLQATCGKVVDGDQVPQLPANMRIQFPKASAVLQQEKDAGTETLSAAFEQKDASKNKSWAKSAEQSRDSNLRRLNADLSIWCRNLLHGGLESLLKATARQSASQVPVSRSLFSSCLRKLPQFMITEQSRAEEEDGTHNTDVVSNIYDELESLGTADGAGWRPLRELVRAHGIHLIAACIRERVAPAIVADYFIYSCFHRSAVAEAQLLCAAFVDSLSPSLQSRTSRPQLLEPETSVCLRILTEMSTSSGRWEFFYRQTRRMMENGVLPIEWIASQTMISTWNRVINSITQDAEDAAYAASFLTEVVRKSYLEAETEDDVHGLRLQLRSAKVLVSKQRGHIAESLQPIAKAELVDDEGKEPIVAVHATITNLLTVLLSVNLIRSEASTTQLVSSDDSCFSVLRTLALEACRFLELKGGGAIEDQLSQQRMAHAFICVLAFSLASRNSMTTEDSIVESTLRGCVKETHSSSVTSDVVQLFLCSVAQCCDQGRAKSGFAFLKIMATALPQISSAFFQPICSSVAFGYAEQSKQADHLEWALDLEESFNMFTDRTSSKRQEQNQQTPARVSSQVKGGFRWEEGIGEWVAKTPYTSIHPSIQIRDLQLQKPVSTTEPSNLLSERKSVELDREGLRAKRMPLLQAGGPMIRSDRSPLRMEGTISCTLGQDQGQRSSAGRQLPGSELSTSKSYSHKNSALVRGRGIRSAKPEPWHGGVSERVVIYQDDSESSDELSTTPSSKREALIALSALENRMGLKAQTKVWRRHSDGSGKSQELERLPRKWRCSSRSARPYAWGRSEDGSEDELCM